MNAKVEKRRNFLINTAYFTLMIGAFYLFIEYVFWIVSPFVFSFLIAAILQKPINAIISKVKVKKGILSVFFVLIFFGIIFTLLALIGMTIVSEIKGLVSYLVERFENLSGILSALEGRIIKFLAFLPDFLENSAVDFIKDIFGHTATASSSADVVTGGNKVTSFFKDFDFTLLATPLNGIWSTAKQIPTLFASTVITIVASCFMTSDYDNIVNFFKRQFSVKKRQSFGAAKRIFFTSITKMIKSYIIIILITFAELLIGLNILRLLKIYEGGFIVAIALITAVLDILPVLGTGSILLPWSIYMMVNDNIPLGIGIIIIYLIISIVRQVVEPKLVALNLGLSPILTIMAMFIGLQLFGFIGLFLLPITVILIKLLNDEGIIHVWKTAKDEASENTENTDIAI